MHRMLVLSLLITLLALLKVQTEATPCKYDESACPCFKLLKDDDLTEGQQATVTVLHRIVDMFEDGIEDTCDELEDVLECVVNKTKHCEGTETGKCKEFYEGLKEQVPEICEEHKQELIDNSKCVNATSFKSDLEACESFIKGFTMDKKPTCEALQNTTKCIDDVLDQCPAVHDTLENLFDEYLEHYFDVDDCDLHDAASASLSTLTLLLVSLLVSYLVISTV